MERGRPVRHIFPVRRPIRDVHGHLPRPILKSAHGGMITRNGRALQGSRRDDRGDNRRIVGFCRRSVVAPIYRARGAWYDSQQLDASSSTVRIKKELSPLPDLSRRVNGIISATRRALSRPVVASPGLQVATEESQKVAECVVKRFIATALVSLIVLLMTGLAPGSSLAHAGVASSRAASSIWSRLQHSDGAIHCARDWSCHRGPTRARRHWRPVERFAEQFADLAELSLRRRPFWPALLLKSGGRRLSPLARRTVSNHGSRASTPRHLDKRKRSLLHHARPCGSTNANPTDACPTDACPAHASSADSRGRCALHSGCEHAQRRSRVEAYGGDARQ